VDDKIESTESEVLTRQSELRKGTFQSLVQRGLLSESEAEKTGINFSGSGDKRQATKSEYLYGVLVPFVHHKGVQIEKSQTNTRVSVESSDFKGRSRESDFDVKSVGSDAEINKRILERALYEGNVSALPVIAERANDKVPTAQYLDRSVIEDRLANSLVVVVPEGLLPSHVINPDSLEVLCKGKIEPETMAFVLVPTKFFHEAVGYFEKEQSGVRVISVPDIETVLFEGTQNSKTCRMPNYAGFLNELAEVSLEPLFVHGVRLPTLEDVKAGGCFGIGK
jgi:hypothetical protein